MQNHKKFVKHHNVIVSKNKYKAEQVVGHENSDTTFNWLLTLKQTVHLKLEQLPII